MKYFASLESKVGPSALPHNSCKLLGFDLLVMPAGKQHTADTGEREVLAVILGGKAAFEVAGKRFEKVGGRPNVFAGEPYSVYLPAGVEYTVTDDGPVQVAMTSAPSDLHTEPYVIGPERVANQGEEENFTVRDNTIMMAPVGCHTVVSAPGYMTYYLWFLAGEHRVQATTDDPTLSWVSRTVPMLKELGF